MILKQKLEACDLHWNRLNLAFEKIKKYYPFEESHLPLANSDD